MNCENCGIEVDYPMALCSPCLYLAFYGTWVDPVQAHRAREERLTNRRWQMRFNLGLINPNHASSLARKGMEKI